jgi:predicted alpha/beta-fold hydrolase
MRLIRGHLRTVIPRLAEAVAPAPEPPSRDWSTTVADPKVGPVRLTGRWSDPDGGPGGGGERPLLLVVHGLGGSAGSRYARRAAAVALAAGFACLRLNLRGSDRLGEDFYHAGLVSDLAAALASPELAGYRRVYALGFSLGGHLALRLAAEPGEATGSRLGAVAALAAPLDLALGAAAIDRPRSAPYRRYLLGSLKQIYRAVAARRPVPLPVDQARRIRWIREWDERVVAPRHGFAGADDYYRRESVASRLGGLRVPALLVAAEDDPMVPAAALRPALAAAPEALEVRWLRAGGHLGIAAPADLGLGGAAGAGVEEQMLGWLAAAG